VGTKIARYKKPKHVLFFISLPKTREGEIDQEQVKKDYGEKEATESENDIRLGHHSSAE